MSASELKPCPFCGGPSDFSDDGYTGYVHCTHCLIRTDDYYSWRDKNWKETAAQEWNDRPKEEKAYEIADELAQAIADHFGVKIGKHNSANNPWNNALVWIHPMTPEMRSDGFYYCSRCGQKLENWGYCPNCGQRLRR